MDALCRDCLTLAAPRGGRCAACGSPRLVTHPERDALAIAHVDCDAFFAAVEKRDNPALRDRPVIIGGGRRGVVATACYVARTYGVRSAMPMFKALRACPDAVVIRPDLAKYSAIGREVRAQMQALTPLVEPVSIDEAFLDLSGTQALHGAAPAAVLARFAWDVETRIGITVSIGLSYCKFLAKIASDLDKPRGFAVLGRAEAPEFLAPRPVSILPGIGPATVKRLAEAGLTRVGDLARTSLVTLERIAGRDGARLAALARGEDNRPVRTERETKSVSAETTFDEDIASFERLEPILWRLCEKVATRLRKADLAARSVTLKLKTTDFQIRTRAHSGLPPTQVARRLFEAARPLLTTACDGSRYRLIGIGAGDLAPGDTADKGDLVDQSAPRQARGERALDRLREKFGRDAIVSGLDFGKRRS